MKNKLGLRVDEKLVELYQKSLHTNSNFFEVGGIISNPRTGFIGGIISSPGCPISPGQVDKYVSQEG